MLICRWIFDEFLERKCKFQFSLLLCNAAHVITIRHLVRATLFDGPRGVVVWFLSIEGDLLNVFTSENHGKRLPVNHHVCNYGYYCSIKGHKAKAVLTKRMCDIATTKIFLYTSFVHLHKTMKWLCYTVPLWGFMQQTSIVHFKGSVAHSHWMYKDVPHVIFIALSWSAVVQVKTPFYSVIKGETCAKLKNQICLNCCVEILMCF